MGTILILHIDPFHHQLPGRPRPSRHPPGSSPSCSAAASGMAPSRLITGFERSNTWQLSSAKSWAALR